MSKNPFINAFSASFYIFFVVVVMNFATQSLRDKPDTFFAPISALFMLTLSAVVMSYIFFYNPILLLIEGKKKDALNLFVKTVAIFAIITTLVLLSMTFGLI